MTELEQFKAMLDRAQIVYKEKPRTIPGKSLGTTEIPGTQIEISAGDGPNQDGYMMFVSISEFDIDGKLTKWGVWE